MKRKSSRKSEKHENDSRNGVDDENVKTDESNAEDDDEPDYEVEGILEEKSIKGVRHYLIRWKGYTEESDTWEPETTLDCDELIREFKKKKPKKDKSKKAKKLLKEDENGEVVEGEYEVDRIIDVYFRKDGKREFLVHWKGYSSNDNTWEPEDNMDCADLIQRFMEKVEEAKKVDTRELRVNRKPVQRLTLMTNDSGRRLSRRNQGKQTIHYYNAE